MNLNTRDFVEKLMTQEEAYQQILECLTNLKYEIHCCLRETFGKFLGKLAINQHAIGVKNEIEDNSRLTINYRR